MPDRRASSMLVGGRVFHNGRWLVPLPLLMLLVLGRMSARKRRFTQFVQRNSTYRRRGRQSEERHTAVCSCFCKSAVAKICQAIGKFQCQVKVWLKVLSFCSGQEAAFAVPCCTETLAGAHDGQGRLLAGSVTLSRGCVAMEQLTRISPHLLVKLSLPSLASGAEGEAVLKKLAQMRGQLRALKEVSVHIAPPRLPRVTGESREDRTQAVSGLASALSAALPRGLDSFHANLRGGCLLADDCVLAELVSATPKRLTRLGLDLNSFSCRDAHAVARVIARVTGLRELRLLFHGRSFAWLGSGMEDAGTEELASALPAGLEKLHLMLESSCQGAAALCKALPASLQQLALDLQVTAPNANTALAQALAAALGGLTVLQLRLADFNMSLSDLRSVASALPSSLSDLRLDLCCRDVGDDGASALAANLPKGLERLTLCLRDWRFTAVGMRLLASAIPRSVRQFKLVVSSSTIGVSGARALAANLPVGMTRLNISLRHCCLGRDGEQVFRPLARRWNALPHSWVRVYEKTAASVGLQRCCEWDLWED
ncbi:unnamed protein product [Symbiodinium natans]|uniref:Uncharacterized protein n=1 Tax=Symbiodinium natans TaxID=878477 RepID=A0A812U477_9DINO|nr:unnamed protein product [Symbiodinium natans]